jgi:hypothetical protein
VQEAEGEAQHQLSTCNLVGNGCNLGLKKLAYHHVFICGYTPTELHMVRAIVTANLV